MKTTSFGDIHATGDDRRPSSGESNVVGQPPITPGTGVLGTDWLPGPSDGTQSPAVVSFIDFHSRFRRGLAANHRIGYEAGAELADHARSGRAVAVAQAGREARRVTFHLGQHGRFASFHPLARSRRHHETLARTYTSAIRWLG